MRGGGWEPCDADDVEGVSVAHEAGAGAVALVGGAGEVQRCVESIVRARRKVALAKFRLPGGPCGNRVLQVKKGYQTPYKFLARIIRVLSCLGPPEPPVPA